MAQTGKLGTVDSLLANVQPAFAAGDPTLPAIAAESGRLGGQLAGTVLGLGGTIGASVIHVSAASVLALAQTANPAPTFAPHASPLWALGGQDSQLGDTELAFAGLDAEPPTIATQSGRLGGRLGDLMPGFGGLVGAGVIHLSAESALAIAQTADPAPTFFPHISPAWVLGGRDAQPGVIQPAFTGAEEARPATGDHTGQLGTLHSLLGNMRPALGEEEGGGANIVHATADSDLSLSGEAGVTAILGCAASSPMDLADLAQATRALVCAAESVLAITDTAARNDLLSGSAESSIGLDVAADFAAARAVAAESVLALTDAAANIGGQLIEAAAQSQLTVDAATGFTVARAATAESALVLDDSAARNNLLTGSAESSIGLETTAHFSAVRTMAAESELSLSVDVERVLPAVIDVSAQSAISLTASAGRNNLVAATAENQLALDAAAACVHIVPTPVSAASAIELGTTAANTVARTAWAESDDLFLWDWASVVVTRKLAAESRLTLAQTERTARPWYLSAQTPIQTITKEYDPAVGHLVERIDGLQDAAKAARPLTLTVHQPIPLGQSASAVKVKPTAINVSAESILDLLSEVRPNKTGDVGHWLSLTQTATVDKCNPARSALELSGAAAVAHTGSRGAGSVLNLNQSAAYYLVSSGILQRYRPFVGAGAPGAPTPPPVELDGPRPGVTVPFQLVYPATGTVIDSVTLRAPNFGNKDRLSFNRVLRETRGGTLIVFADPMWPRIQTQVLNFSGLRSDQARQLLTFLEAHLGEEVGVYDWEHRYWVGVITMPNDPVVQDGRDSFSASFEFEGELVPA